MSKALAKKDEKANLPAIADYGDFAGVGYEQIGRDDIAIPFMAILQANSPQCLDQAAFPDAKAGMFLNTASNEFIPGPKGFFFVPCSKEHQYVEWRPRDAGSGFIGTHAPDSETTAAAKAAAEQFGKYKTDEGNDLVETFYVYGLVLESPEATSGIPAVLAFKSKGIKPYKGLMYRLQTVKGSKAPLFANRLHVTTALEKSPKGSFFNYVFKFAVNDDVKQSLIAPKIGDEVNPLLIAGKELYDALKEGRVQVKHDDARKVGGEESGGAGGEVETPF